ncbi:hypothetical protein [Streptomyces sp. TLI_171]|uniref:hypothetical protein n=1 Tax=Streptomyces sp. TLI_171 TaxID=1938859 RepID=UPI00217E7795|nr:hypothetical protein [Streptomyces sp. TLI_171]
MQREVAQRLPDRLVRRRTGAQQALELVGGGDLENAERAKDVRAQRGGRAVRVGGAAPERGPSRPGRTGRLDDVGPVVVVVGLAVVVVGLGGALAGAHGRLLVAVVGALPSRDIRRS